MLKGLYEMIHFEKPLSSEEIYSGKIIHVTRDTVEVENGKKKFREVVHHPGGACIAAVTENNEVYMVRQYRYPLQREILELPAGKLEKGEDPFEAAKRELREECGLTADHYTDLHTFYPSVGYTSEIIYTWMATGLHEAELALDEDEFLTPVKVPLTEAWEMVMDGRIADGKTVAALLKIKMMM